MILVPYMLSVKDNFFRHQGFLFKENRLCVSNCFIRELFISEAHGRGLIEHFRTAKTLEVLHEYFY
jgi:hypothetical protein